MKLGRDEEALTSFNKALAIDPDYAKALYHKALCYSLQREYDIALENLQLAVRLDPNLRSDAQSEAAFNDLRNDDWFRELVGF